MRSVIAVLLLAATLPFAAPAEAAPKWCAINSEGNSNCGFDSIDACRSITIGNGGHCMPEAPVGHLQPTTDTVRTAAAVDPAKKQRDEFDAVVERATKRTQNLNFCRGC